MARNGLTGFVRCHRQVINSVLIKNDVGGTSELPVGSYRVRITKTWGDYETGQRCVGVLLDPKDIERSRRAGTTGKKPDDYKRYPNNPELYARAVEAVASFDPSIVYFVASDFTPDAR
jgi:hypothetical protein